MISHWLPVAASAHAAALDAVLTATHWHMLLVFALGATVLIVALVRFRRGAQPQPREGRVPTWWAVLALGLVVAGDVAILTSRALPAWSARVAPPPAGSTPLEVRVIAEQFAWNIHYPGPDARFGRTEATLISASNPVGIDRADAEAADDIGLLNVLTLPIDRTIVVHLSSRDVIHSFTLPEMRVKQDATPGMVARTWFTPSMLGDWEIGCSQLCGLGHYRMRGEYHIVSADDWRRWQLDELARLR